MKKLLLGTSALVAVGLTAGTAVAQNLTANVSGYHRNWAMFYDHSSNARINGSEPRSFSMTSNSEVYFVGSVKLANGLTYGFRTEFESWSQTGASATGYDHVDETWAYMRGSFGEFRFGEEDDARKLKGSAPFIGGLLSGDSGDAVYGLSTNNTFFNVENDSPKIIYLSPSFGGFSFAASYAPDATKGTRSFSVQGETDCDGSQSRGCNGNAWSVAADYRGTFGTTKLGGSIGYTGSENEVSTVKDVAAFRADAFVNFSGIELSGAYAKDINALGSNLDRTVYDLGVLYTTGPWNIGAIYTYGKEERAAATTKKNTIVVGAAYNLGSGVSALAGLSYQKADAGHSAGGVTSVNGGDLKSTTLIAGIAANF